ncbi:MAG: DNA-directed RNA polymerase subunit beta' [Deltaproteobacteria bacterium]|nr:DNA-directed RNA polymerase subunit beta' [Deltaproteobacteria bacterium]
MDTLYDFFAKPTDPRMYKAVQVSLASSTQIREWSHGEIKKPETINYRTFKPERDGLFCAKIFGPTKDYECNCGKYKRMKHRGVICEKCGVEVIQSKVRRDRMGHIELATPVSHIWFLKSLPSKIGNLLDLTLKNMEKVLYFDSYIVIDPKDTGLKAGQLLSEEKYREALEIFGGKFEAGIGAEAVQQLLETIDLQALYQELREEIRATGSAAKRQKLSKRLKIVDAFRRSGVNPVWMIMDVIPVLPPDLRPLVPLEGGRFATSDLNDLYRRVINRNNRLRRLIDLKAPDIIVRNEKRMLQEAVDVLFDNGRHGRVVTGTNKRPLKSLSDTLKGKQGRFRQNLLGKRVDYSGRTVITVGPNLRLHQCGLPKKMALELFKPFVYYRLERKALVSTIKSAKKMVEREVPEVWDTLDEVVKEYPVLLNRAPTLHRLGIQAFEPILIEGKAIQLHPLVCTAFNADFDGDQMAVHIPLSVESQIEARVLMLSSNNILSPANGSPIIVPSQDIVLGVYYMTKGIPGAKGEGKVFANPEEVRSAFDAESVGLHAQITVRMDGKRVETTVGRILFWEIMPKDNVLVLRHILATTKDEAKLALNKLKSGDAFTDLVATYSKSLDKDNNGLLGRMSKDEFVRIFNSADQEVDALYELEKGQISGIISENENRFHVFEVVEKHPAIPFEIVNTLQDKKTLRRLIDYAYRNLGPKATVVLSDRLKDLGYQASTEGGLSISIDAMIIPSTKWDILSQAEEQVTEIGRQYTEGLITQGEKYNKVVDIWAKATDDVANEMMDVMKTPSVTDGKGTPVLDDQGQPVVKEVMNPIFMMADSGARGSKDQMRQLAGMRGLMAKPSGEIIETPITANFREGLSVLQYFISTHGARKGLADTALKTANSGYLTRRLADVAQDCAVVEDDCGTILGVEVVPLMEGGEVIQELGERILGRTAVDDIVDTFTEEVLVVAGEEVDEAGVQRIVDAGLTSTKIRSVLTCRTKYGVCAKCYGRDLAHGAKVEIGQAVGILAAQSIGEPGTQLTMRTFHIGGTASRRVEQADIRARVHGTVRFDEDLNVVKNAEEKNVIMNRRGGSFAIFGEDGRERERHPVIYGAHLLVQDDQDVKAGDVLAVWDPFTTPIITEVAGTVKFGDIAAGKTMQEKVDPVTGKSSRTVIESKAGEFRPRISIKDEKGKTSKLPKGSGLARYILPTGAILLVEEHDPVKAGDVVAKLPRATTKTKDITGGLPRVAELFEVRKPKEAAILSEIDGYVSIAKATKKGKQKVTITPVEVGEKKEYLIPRGKHVNVYEGDYIRAGEPLIGGSANPQDILNIKGEVSLARYLVDEVQEVYRLQGVRINDKHIEVIVRQMMRRVKVTDIGDTDFILEEHVDRIRFEEANRAVIDDGGQPAVAEPLILGITKASLSTDSFISAASFQETTKVLTDASIAGKKDYLRGLKENVIMGRIIPAGTGLAQYSDLNLEST